MSFGSVVELDSYEIGGERRFEDLGSTASGRIRKIVMTERRDLMRVVTAFDASPAEERYYIREMVKRYE